MFAIAKTADLGNSGAVHRFSAEFAGAHQPFAASQRMRSVGCRTKPEGRLSWRLNFAGRCANSGEQRRAAAHRGPWSVVRGPWSVQSEAFFVAMQATKNPMMPFGVDCRPLRSLALQQDSPFARIR
jgi:hypothetical protein